MASANIDRRDTIERVYPLEAFAQDAARNRQTTNQVLFGVRVMSAPDAIGDFELERASRHVGEAAAATFLAPQRRSEWPANAASDAASSIRPERHDDYADFLGEIIAAARRFGYDAAASPGRGDPRIKGLRQ